MAKKGKKKTSAKKQRPPVKPSILTRISPEEEYQVISNQAHALCQQLIRTSDETAKTFQFSANLLEYIEIIRLSNEKISNVLLKRSEHLEEAGVAGVCGDNYNAHLSLNKSWTDLESFTEGMYKSSIISELAEEVQFLYCLSMTANLLKQYAMGSRNEETADQKRQLQVLACMANYYLDNRKLSSEYIKTMDFIIARILKFRVFFQSSLTQDVNNMEAVFEYLLPNIDEWKNNPDKDLEFRYRNCIATSLYNELLMHWGNKFSELDNAEVNILVDFLDKNIANTLNSHLTHGGASDTDAIKTTIDQLLLMSKHAFVTAQDKIDKKNSLLKKYLMDEKVNFSNLSTSKSRILKKELEHYITLKRAYFKIRDCILRSYMITISNLVFDDEVLNEILTTQTKVMNVSFNNRKLSVPYPLIGTDADGKKSIISGTNFDVVMEQLKPMQVLHEIKNTEQPLLSEESAKATEEGNSYNTTLIHRKPKTLAKGSRAGGITTSIAEKSAPEKLSQKEVTKNDRLFTLYQSTGSDLAIYELHESVNALIAQGMRATIKNHFDEARQLMESAENLFKVVAKEAELLPLEMKVWIGLTGAEINIFGYFLENKAINHFNKIEKLNKEDLKFINKLYGYRYGRTKNVIYYANKCQLIISDLSSSDVNVEELNKFLSFIYTQIESMIEYSVRELKHKKNAEERLEQISFGREQVRAKMGDKWSKNPHPKNDFTKEKLQLQAFINESEVVQSRSDTHTSDVAASTPEEVALPIKLEPAYTISVSTTTGSLHKFLFNLLNPIAISNAIIYLQGDFLHNLSPQVREVHFSGQLRVISSVNVAAYEHFRESSSPGLDITNVIVPLTGNAFKDISSTTFFNPQIFTLDTVIAKVKCNDSKLEISIFDPQKYMKKDAIERKLSLTNPETEMKPHEMFQVIEHMTHGFVPDKVLQKKIQTWNAQEITSNDKKKLVQAFRKLYVRFFYTNHEERFFKALRSQENLVTKLFSSTDFVHQLIELGENQTAVTFRKIYQSLSAENDKYHFISNLHKYGVIESLWGVKGKELSEEERNEVLCDLEKPPKSQECTEHNAQSKKITSSLISQGIFAPSKRLEETSEPKPSLPSLA